MREIAYFTREEWIMTGRTIRRAVAVVLSILVAGMAAQAQAWMDKIPEGHDVNTLCKLEPEAQCSWAVRIGVQAPGVDLHDASLSSMRLDKANLQRANMRGAILQLSNLKEANLMLANLEGAHMHGVNLRGADLRMANLKNVNLLDADLTGADLTGAFMEGTLIIKARFDHATWTNGRPCLEGSLGECIQAP